MKKLVFLDERSGGFTNLTKVLQTMKLAMIDLGGFKKCGALDRLISEVLITVIENMPTLPQKRKFHKNLPPKY